MSSGGPFAKSDPKNIPGYEFVRLYAVNLRHAKHGDRGVALAMGAMLDACLKSLIMARSKADDATLGSVFSERGLLGGLTDKVQFLYLTGSFSTIAYEDLSILAKVRNRFAHEEEVDNFSHPRVKGQIENLKLLNIVVSVDDGPTRLYKDLFDTFVFDFTKPDDIFLATIVLFTAFAKSGALPEGMSMHPIA